MPQFTNILTGEKGIITCSSDSNCTQVFSMSDMDDADVAAGHVQFEVIDDPDSSVEEPVSVDHAALCQLMATQLKTHTVAPTQEFMAHTFHLLHAGTSGLMRNGDGKFLEFVPEVSNVKTLTQSVSVSEGGTVVEQGKTLTQSVSVGDGGAVVEQKTLTQSVSVRPQKSRGSTVGGLATSTHVRAVTRPRAQWGSARGVYSAVSSVQFSSFAENRVVPGVDVLRQLDIVTQDTIAAETISTSGVWVGLDKVDSHCDRESGGVESTGDTLQTSLALGAAEASKNVELTLSQDLTQEISGKSNVEFESTNVELTLSQGLAHVAFKAWHRSLSFAVEIDDDASWLTRQVLTGESGGVADNITALALACFEDARMQWRLCFQDALGLHLQSLGMTPHAANTIAADVGRGPGKFLLALPCINWQEAAQAVLHEYRIAWPCLTETDYARDLCLV